MSLTIKILFDNTAKNKEFINLWGFSAYIEIDNHKILFDTGSNGRILLKNAQKLQIDLQKIDTLFISHSHWDHVGGIDSVIELNPNLELILPSNISKHWIADLKKMVKSVKIIDQQPTELFSNIFSTGIMAEEAEQSLILNTNKGLVIFTGCGHPKIENIISKAQFLLNKEIFYIIGGFHLLHQTENQILHTIKQIKTHYITPTHCTGELAIDLFRKYFENKFIEGGVGQEICFDLNLK